MVKTVAEFIKQMHGWKFPVAPEIICEKLNIKIERIDLPKYLRGYYDIEKRTIFINSDLDKYSTRLTIAMEIRQSQFKEVLRPQEKEKFGMELLMPTSEFISVWNDSVPAQVMECALYFDVSPAIIISRVKYLHRKKLIRPRLHKNLSDIL